MTIFIGVDLHKTQFTVSSNVEGGMHGKFLTTSTGYAKFEESIRRWQLQHHEIRIGVESTGNTRVFKDRMEELGCEVVVINTLKFKVVTESVKKTDKHDAATIAEFLAKDMLPEAYICSKENEHLRRLLKVRKTLKQTAVSVKNQVHGMMLSLGLEDQKASLQSKKGRQKILDTLQSAAIELEAHQLFETIDLLESQVKKLEQQLEQILPEREDAKLLMMIPGCGIISALTIVAYMDDVRRFSSAKKFASYAGLAPWTQNSNETVHHGRITKRGPEPLRTALVQVVLGMIRMKRTTASFLIMQKYQSIKSAKGSGKSIIASVRKVSNIIWAMLTHDEPFRPEMMLENSQNTRRAISA
jgi:transposase